MAKILIGKYVGTIYPEGEGFTGAISLGFAPSGKRIRPKRKGKTEAEVQEKLVKLVKDLESGVTSSEKYTVRDAVEDWLKKGLRGRDPKTIDTNRILANKNVIPLIGKTKLKDLRADDVDDWLDDLADHLSTATLRRIHSILKRSIRQAQARDMVMRNVAELVTTPKGTEGRPSKALTSDQATAMLEQAKRFRLHAYFVLSLMTGIRTEEARKLRWDHVVAWVDEEWRPVAEAGFDHDRFAVYIWRSVRANGDTKTRKSRRTLELPQKVAEAPSRAPREAAEGQGEGGQGVAGQRPRLLHARGQGGPRGQRPPVLPQDHDPGEGRGAMDAEGTPPLVRLDHERPRCAYRGHRRPLRPLRIDDH